jgi:hypothetical protein
VQNVPRSQQAVTGRDPRGGDLDLLELMTWSDPFLGTLGLTNVFRDCQGPLTSSQKLARLPTMKLGTCDDLVCEAFCGDFSFPWLLESTSSICTLLLCRLQTSLSRTVSSC